jgi:hypothetical protein
MKKLFQPNIGKTGRILRGLIGLILLGVAALSGSLAFIGSRAPGWRWWGRSVCLKRCAAGVPRGRAAWKRAGDGPRLRRFLGEFEPKKGVWTTKQRSNKAVEEAAEVPSPPLLGCQFNSGFQVEMRVWTATGGVTARDRRLKRGLKRGLVAPANFRHTPRHVRTSLPQHGRRPPQESRRLRLRHGQLRRSTSTLSEKALKKGMEEMSREFTEKDSELYAKAWTATQENLCNQCFKLVSWPLVAMRETFVW